MITPLSSTEINPAPPKNPRQPPRRLRNLFIFQSRRRPKLWFPELPDRKDSPEKWEMARQTCIQRDFVSGALLKEHGISDKMRICEDIADLDEILIPKYLKADHEARYHQNQYYLFQWAFALLAFFSTFVATVTTVLVGIDVNGAKFFGALTTFLSIMTGVVVTINSRERPKLQWFKMRRIAEDLRRYYFFYLAHLPPFDVKNSTYMLKLTVNKIEKSDTSRLETPNNPESQVPLDPLEAQHLLTVYRQMRLEYQIDYYTQRINEYDFNSDVTFLLSILIPAAAAVLAAFNFGSPNQPISAIVILLPTLAALIVSFQRIYDWERQKTLYADAVARLETISIVDSTITESVRELQGLIQKAESIFASEADQWGQPVAEQQEDQFTDQQLFDAYVKKSGLNETQINQIRDIVGGPR